MPLFNNFLTPTQRIPLRREFKGSGFDNFKLALTGARADGSSSTYGKIIDGALPIIGSVVGNYFGGPVLGALGGKLGQLGATGLNAGSRNILAGTSGAEIDALSTQKDQNNDALVSLIGNAAGQIAGGISENSGRTGSKSENKILDDTLRGVSQDSIGDYLSDNASSTDYTSALSDIANSLSGIGQKTKQPTTLEKLFGGSNNSNQLDWAALGNSLMGQRQMTNPTNQNNFQINQGNNSSFIPNNDPNSSIRYLQGAQRPVDPYADQGYASPNGFDGAQYQDPFDQTNYRYQSGFANGGETFNGFASESNGVKSYSNFAPDVEKAVEAKATPKPAGGDIKTRISMAEGTFNRPDGYTQKNSVGPGHYGKYQLSPDLIFKYAPGLSIDQFLSSPEAQEGAMDRLLTQYDSEAQNVRKQTGTNWDDDSLRLLIHFQGSPKGIEMLKNPEMLTKKTKNNPSVMDYIDKRSFNIFANGGENTMIYPESDKTTEDYWMVEKNPEIDPIVGKLAFGQARFGERILDQQSNLIIKNIMHSDEPVEIKEELLGRHLFSELLTHSDFGGKSNTIVQSFAKGGTPTKKGNTLGIRTPAELKPKVSAFQTQYNEWAKQNGLPTIAVDGVFGQKTERAMQNWNANNPALDAFTYKTGVTLDPNTGKKNAVLAGLDYEESASTRNPQLLAGAAPLTSIDTNLPEQAAALRTSLENGAAPILPQTQTSTATSSKTPLTPYERSNLFGNLSDLATAGVGALIGQTQIPRYTPTQEYKNMFADVVAQKDQGFSAAEQAAINQGLQSNYATNVNAIKNISGGGGTQGAVLGALGRASNQLDNSYLQSAIQDIGLKRQNNARYQNAVMTDLGIDQQIFQQDAQQALATKQAGLTLLDRSLGNIQQRQQFNSQYGEGTQYAQLQQSMIDAANSQRLKSEGLVDMYRRMLEQKAKPTTTII